MAEKVLRRDGVALALTDVGAGGPPLLFVHGWTCNRRFWRRQVPAFSRRQRVVAVDLRGHGRSQAPHQDYTMEAFADDLAWLVGELGLARPVVVGHSMGGLIALTMAFRHPQALRAAVMVDSPLTPMPPEMTPQIAQFQQALASPMHRQALEQFVRGLMFLPTTPKTLADWVVGEMLATPQHVAASAFAGILAALERLPQGEVPVPTLYVAATNPLSPPAEVKARYPNMATAQVVGASHFLQLEVPDQFNAMLRRFLEVGI